MMNLHPLPHAQISELLGSMACFHGLSSECLEGLSVGARQFSLDRNQPLYRKGDAAVEVYLLVSGRIKLVLPLASGAERVVTMLEPGHCLGVAAAYLSLPHATHAIASLDSHLIAVDRAVLLRQAACDAALACRLLGVVATSKLGLMRDLESCTPRSSLERVACFLLQHRPHSGAGQYDIELDTSKREVAARLNIAQETLSRAFHHLSEVGAIELHGRCIHVLNSSKLASLSRAGAAAH